MALNLPNGSSVAIASTIAASKAMSAVSNAAEAVATLEAAHGVVVSDILIVSSGWSELDQRVARASAVATNDVTLEDINTASTLRFPAGSGIGSVREISAWTAITQILEFDTVGGDQQFFQYQFLESYSQRQIPTVRSPQSINMALGDDQSLPWYDVIVAAAEGGAPVPMRITLPSGAKLFYNGYWSINKTPRMSVNNAMAVDVTFAFAAELTRYAS